MIEGLQSVMLYVDNQDQSVAFWTKDLGFVIKSEDIIYDDYKSVEVAPSLDSQTSIVIFDKEFIREASPEVNLGTPSLMFQVKDIDELYTDLNNKGIRCGDIVETPDGRVFNFADDEDNYFAVNEIRQDVFGVMLHEPVIKLRNSTIMVVDRKADWPFTPAFTQIYVEDVSETLKRATENGATIITEPTDYIRVKFSRILDPHKNIWWIYEMLDDYDWSKDFNTENGEIKKSDRSEYIRDTIVEAMNKL